MQNDNMYVSEFLRKVEGFYTKGYIPCWLAGTDRKKSKNYFGTERPELFEPMYSSGVTVAVGCDFGQTTASYLKGYGVPLEVIYTVRQYIGLKKMDAVQALYEKPLTLTVDDAKKLSVAVHTGYVEKFVEPGYNRDAKGIKFISLPKEAKACIVSMCYQKGVGGVRRDFKHTWAALLACDWATAYKKLTNRYLWNDFKNRRKQEGELLVDLL